MKLPYEYCITQFFVRRSQYTTVFREMIKRLWLFWEVLMKKRRMTSNYSTYTVFAFSKLEIKCTYSGPSSYKVTPSAIKWFPYKRDYLMHANPSFFICILFSKK